MDRLQTEFDVRVRWTSFPLHPETPQEGMALEDLFAGRNVDLPRMLAHLRQVAAQLNLEFGERANTYNSRMAQEVGKWAEEQGRGPEYHLAVFKAYFVHGHNIADPEKLVSICAQLGLDRGESADVLTNRTYRDQVDRDWERSQRLGITAVPTFRLGETNMVGAQPYQRLGQLLDSRQVPRKRNRPRDLNGAPI